MDENKKKAFKEIINQLHSGATPEEVKERFGQVLENVSPADIAKIEQELLEEGMPREQIRRLCDVHMAVMRDQLEKRSWKSQSDIRSTFFLKSTKRCFRLEKSLVS